MSSYYGIIFPEYWDGKTGQDIQRAGGAAATLLGAFLMSNRHANMIGLYRLPIADIRLPLSRSKIMASFVVLAAVDYAFYDVATEFVWVKEMARIRVGIRARTGSLTKGDNRIGFINRLYDDCEDNPFLGEFYERYVKTLYLKRKRTCEHYPNISALERGSVAPPKPVTGSGTGTGTDQDQIRNKTGRSAPLTRRVDEIRISVLTKLVHTILDEGKTDPLDLPEVVKRRAAHAHMAYDSESVGKAIDSAKAQRARKVPA